MRIFVIVWCLCYVFIITNEHGLDEREIIGVEGSIHNILQPHLAEHGPAVFAEMLHLHPLFQMLRSKFHNITLEQLTTTEKFHTVTGAIVSEFVDCIDKNMRNTTSLGDCFYNVLQSDRHFNIGYDQAKVLVQAMKNHLHRSLSSGLVGSLESGWTKVFEILLEAFKRASNDVEN